MTAKERITQAVNAMTGEDIWVKDDSLNVLMKEAEEVFFKDGDFIMNFPEMGVTLSKNGYLSTSEGTLYWRITGIRKGDDTRTYTENNYSMPPVIL